MQVTFFLYLALLAHPFPPGTQQEHPVAEITWPDKTKIRKEIVLTEEQKILAAKFNANLPTPFHADYEDYLADEIYWKKVGEYNAYWGITQDQLTGKKR